MEKKDYHKAITANVSAEEALNKISEVNKWWTSNFKGSAKNLNDVFTVEFGTTNVTFKVEEVVPNKKIVWRVTDCFLDWLNNKEEWKNTKVMFELTEEKNQTRIDMTHIGLLPGIECYSACEIGWNQYIGESIPQLLATGQGVLFDD